MLSILPDSNSSGIKPGAVHALQEDRQFYWRTIESKNNHLVRRYAFHYRYKTGAELAVLNELWPIVNDRLNYFMPTKNPIDWSSDRSGSRKRLYDTPKTPYHRLLDSGILSWAQQAELAAYKATLDPIQIAEPIDRLQQRLIALAAEKTHNLEIEVQTQNHHRIPETSGLKLHRPAS